MSETRWTAGPWHVTSTMHGWDIETDDDLIAMVPCAVGNNSALSADAHLIAAAPDLAEALEACETALRYWMHWGPPHAETGDALFKASAALAKAKGE